MAETGKSPTDQKDSTGKPQRKPRSRLATRLVGQIRDVMDSTRHGPLPTEISLASRFGVSRKSIRSAFAILEGAGEIHRVPGKGTFVTKGRAADGLFRSPVKRIGVVGQYGLGPDESSNGFYVQLFNGLCMEAFDSEAEIILGGYASVDRVGEPCYRMCDSQRIDGVLLIAITNQELIADLAPRGKPLLLVDHYTDVPGVPCVRIDSRHAAELAVEHLHLLGHRRIAFAGPIDTRVNPERFIGYREAIQRLGLRFDPSLVVAAHTNAVGGASAVSQLLSLPAAKRPTALVTFSLDMASGAIRTLQKFGLVVPRDMSIVSSGGASHADSDYLNRITSVVFDAQDLGRTAARLMIRRLGKGADDQGHGTNLPVQLRDGETSSRLGMSANIFP